VDGRDEPGHDGAGKPLSRDSGGDFKLEIRLY